MMGYYGENKAKVKAYQKVKVEAAPWDSCQLGSTSLGLTFGKAERFCEAPLTLKDPPPSFHS